MCVYRETALTLSKGRCGHATEYFLHTVHLICAELSEVSVALTTIFPTWQQFFRLIKRLAQVMQLIQVLVL